MMYKMYVHCTSSASSLLRTIGQIMDIIYIYIYIYIYMCNTLYAAVVMGKLHLHVHVYVVSRHNLHLVVVYIKYGF